jgi:type II secretory pathway pseudopilin PulG
MRRNPGLGVTLVEILISVAIIAIAFLTILGVIQYGGKSTVKITNYSKATRIAQEFIEEFKHVPIAKYLKDPNITGAEDWFAFNSGDYCPKSTKAVEDYKGELKSLAFDSQLKVIKNTEGLVKYILIRINVDWKEGDGSTDPKPRQVRMANALCNPGVE